MNKKRLFWIGLFSVLILSNLYITFRYMNKVRRIQAAQNILAEIGKELPAQPYALDQKLFQKGARLADERVANLRSFFRKHNSPLYEYADVIVAVSDKYGFDYRLLPAIAMQESGLCRVIPPGSHNCWGWDIYGGKVTRFASFPEAVEAVGQGIRKNYLDRGLLTATQIMEKYTPSSNGSWARAVNSFIQAIGY